MTDRPLVFIPTYNESENVEPLFLEIQNLGLELDVLFVDDNSSDGTGQILDQLAQKHSNVKVVHRSGKLGIGSAHKAGIRWAYDHGYQHLVTMDCDFTHPPRYIPEILKKATGGVSSAFPVEAMGTSSRLPADEAAGRRVDQSALPVRCGSEATENEVCGQYRRCTNGGYDIVVGSRYLQENSLKEWNFYRKVLTYTGHFLTGLLLGMKYDATGGFRYYRLSTIPRYAYDVVTSDGYSFFFESLYVFHFNKYKIAEIPIPLPKRTYGHSKMVFTEIKNSVRLLFTIYFKTLFNREKFEIYEPFSTDPSQKPNPDEQGWDSYWANQKSHAGGLLYDAIAAFYRKFIIRRSLNWFTEKYFSPGAAILHAGCGSGQVDADIRNHFKITGLDISLNALHFYKRTNKDLCKTLHGSIFEIPMPSRSLDGIYNLGVMEHFTESEICKILGEFHRVLKPKGRMVILWPPEFGLSVLFFKSLKWVFTHILRKKDVKFHPDEITRVRSKKQVIQLFESAGFSVLEYYFGPKDVFTYSVICLEKQEQAVVSSKSENGSACTLKSKNAGSVETRI
ncbi:glycosyltransferase [Bdellovibrionota bacterium FG-1]